MEQMRIRRLGRCSVLLLVLMSFSLAGCGLKRNSVSGKVMYKGKPLPAGIVVFVTNDGKAKSPPANIGSDGTYSATKVPVGPVVVCVDALPQLPPEPATPAKDEPKDKKKAAPANFVRIPPKYKDPKKSGLTFDVKPEPASNVFDIVIKEDASAIPSGDIPRKVAP